MPLIVPPSLTEDDGALTQACEDALIVSDFSAILFQVKHIHRAIPSRFFSALCLTSDRLTSKDDNVRHDSNLL